MPWNGPDRGLEQTGADMLDSDKCYAAGATRTLPHRYSFNTGVAGLDDMSSLATARFIEFWCQSHCRGRWRLIFKNHTLKVQFATVSDVVLFCFTDEFFRVASVQNAVIERPRAH